MSGEKLSVGPPYFNSAAGPIVLVLVAAMAIGPLIKWRRDKAREVLNRVAIPILISAMALFALILFAPGIGLFPLLRSEEHTSELQSLMRISYAVFCLKKKNI